MSLNFRGVKTDNLIGQVVAKPATLCLPIGQDPKSVQVNIDWLNYGVGDAKPDFGIVVNLQGISPALALVAVKSVYIDNLGSQVPIYVFFPDTGFTAAMPPLSAGWIPVITNQLKAAIYGIGFTDTNIPLTIVHFCNFPREQSIITVADTANVDPVDISFIGASIQSPNATTATFSATPIGDAGTGRRLLLAVAYSSQNLAVTNTVLTSMTVGGTPATLLSNTSSGVPNNCSLGLFALDAGTTATIVCNFNNAVGRIALGVFDMYNNLSDTPEQVAVNGASWAGSGLMTITGNVTLPKRGGVVSVSCAETSLEVPDTVAFVGYSGVAVDNSSAYSFVATRTGARAFGHYNSPIAQEPYSISASYSQSRTQGVGSGKMVSAVFSPG